MNDVHEFCACGEKSANRCTCPPLVSPEVRERSAEAVKQCLSATDGCDRGRRFYRSGYALECGCADCCRAIAASVMAVLADAGLIRGETPAPVTGSGSWSCCLHPGCCLQRDHAGPHHVVVAYNPTTGQL